MTILQSDLGHSVGGDIGITTSGDLLPVKGLTRGQQRLLRRLVTNPGQYIFQPLYGAGLPRYVGKILDVPKITGLVREHVHLEEAVAKSPAPVITVRPFGVGGLSIRIQYTDAFEGTPTMLSFSVS